MLGLCKEQKQNMSLSETKKFETLQTINNTALGMTVQENTELKNNLVETKEQLENAREEIVNLIQNCDETKEKLQELESQVSVNFVIKFRSQRDVRERLTFLFLFFFAGILEKTYYNVKMLQIRQSFESPKN